MALVECIITLVQNVVPFPPSARSIRFFFLWQTHHRDSLHDAPLSRSPRLQRKVLCDDFLASFSAAKRSSGIHHHARCLSGLLTIIFDVIKFSLD